MAKSKDLFGKEIPEVPSAKILGPGGRRIAEQLDDYKLDELKLFYFAMTGNPVEPKMRKNELCIIIASLLSFENQVAFDSFYKSLPPVAQEAIAVGAFFQFVTVSALEKKYRHPLLSEKSTFGNYTEFVLNKRLRLDLFLIADGDSLYLPSIFRQAFAPWLPKPDGYDPAPVDAPEGTVWSNVDFIREAGLLMARTASAALGKGDLSEAARKGLKKTDIKKLRPHCGLPEFPLAGKLGLDSIDLFVRLAACVDLLRKTDGKDGDEYVKAAVTSFLNPPAKKNSWRQLDGAYLEYLVFLDHLSRRQGFRIEALNGLPPSRKTLAGIFAEIGPGRAWYRIESLYNSRFLRGEPFNFLEPYYEDQGLLIKCDSIQVDKYRIEADEYDRSLPMSGRIREAALGLPLLKAYCYALSLLGVVEIVEAEPELKLERDGKRLPISPYDPAAFVRVTDFGAWCLGLSKEKPAAAARSFEAIADKELLLVTFKGKSIERRLFLESIGEKLGEERYRVTEASFIRGCERLSDIKQRVADFKKLIEAEPSPRWTEYFASVLSRAELFAKPIPALLFPLPKDPALAKAVVSDPSLRPFIIRAEGSGIVVRSADHRKFMKALSAAGFFNEN